MNGPALCDLSDEELMQFFRFAGSHFAVRAFEGKNGKVEIQDIAEIEVEMERRRAMKKQSVSILETLKLRPLDFPSIDKHGKIGDVQVLSSDKHYVCLISGKFSMGRFYPVWFGLNFYDGMMSHQFDPYRTNLTGFQAIWEVEGAEEIAAELEMPYAEWQKEYCIKAKMRRGNKAITEDCPIELFRYLWNRPSTSEDEDDEEDE